MLLLFRVQGHQIPPGLSSCMAVMPFLESRNSEERGERSPAGVWSGEGWCTEGLQVPGKVSSVQLGMWGWSWTGSSAGDRDVMSSTEGMRSWEWDSKERRRAPELTKGDPTSIRQAGEEPRDAPPHLGVNVSSHPLPPGCFAFFQFSQKSLVWPLLQPSLILTGEILSGLDAICEKLKSWGYPVWLI